MINRVIPNLMSLTRFGCWGQNVIEQSRDVVGIDTHSVFLRDEVHVWGLVLPESGTCVTRKMKRDVHLKHQPPWAAKAHFPWAAGQPPG